ncbi:hypothetical protein [Salinibacillus kushneri]|nr:hypothetical protein [Salinibacillus kushneri]
MINSVVTRIHIVNEHVIGNKSESAYVTLRQGSGTNYAETA